MSLKSKAFASNILPFLLIGVGVSAFASDPGLQVWLKFDDDFTNQSFALDSSGNGRNGIRYGRPGFETNWPSQIAGTNGAAAEFHVYLNDGWSTYSRSGDYMAITNLGPLLSMTKASFAVWATSYTGSTNTGRDNTANILDGGARGTQAHGTWYLGRNYAQRNCFLMWHGAGLSEQLNFPETFISGNSGGWHHYGVTVDCSSGDAAVKIYYQGTNCGSAVWTNLDSLLVNTKIWGGSGYGFPWIAIGTGTMGGTAPMEPGEATPYPNGQWFNGALDDLRIYNRVLSDAEMCELAGGPPAPPPPPPPPPPEYRCTVAFTWDPPDPIDIPEGSTITGYALYSGIATHEYTNRVEVGNTNVASITFTEAGRINYIAATCLDSTGNESDYSNEIEFTTPVLKIGRPTNLRVLSVTVSP